MALNTVLAIFIDAYLLKSQNFMLLKMCHINFVLHQLYYYANMYYSVS